MNLPKNEYRISITSDCNMKCIYCHNEGNKKISKLSIEDIELLVKNSYNLGLKGVRLTGGEPLIHDSIIDICKMLSEEYKLNVGINTNAIEINKLLYMINEGWINRVVVGLDYYDATVSKQSVVGLSSKQILENILKMKNKLNDVSISVVYDGNYANVSSLLDWGINNNIRIKIIEEIKNEISDVSSEKYIEMIARIFKDFKLKKDYDEYKQIQGKQENNVVVSFFHSHCRLRECDICKNLYLRVTSNGVLKDCLYYEKNDIDYKKGNVRANIIKSLNRKVDYYYDEKIRVKK